MVLSTANHHSLGENHRLHVGADDQMYPRRLERMVCLVRQHRAHVGKVYLHSYTSPHTKVTLTHAPTKRSLWVSCLRAALHIDVRRRRPI